MHILFTLVVLLFSDSLFSFEINLNNEEKTRVERLLRYFMIEEQFAYTLFGSKPVSMSMIYKNFFTNQAGELPLVADWLVWKELNLRLNARNYFLTEEDLGFCSQIFLVNKIAFCKIVKKNLAIFQKELTKNWDEETILEEFLKNPKLLKQHSGLLGIILGFGTENALAFNRLIHKKIYLYKAPVNFNSREGEELFFIRKLNFMMFDKFSQENRLLKQQYSQDQSNIRKIYEQGDFLEITLQRYIGS